MDTNDIMRQAAHDALVRLQARYGTYTAAAEAIGITRQALRDWRIKGRVSHRYMTDVSRLTGIPVERLRPDLFEGSTAADAA